MAPEYTLKLIPVAPGFSVMTNSIHLSLDPEVQQDPLRMVSGLIQNALGEDDKLTLKVGVD